MNHILLPKLKLQGVCHNALNVKMAQTVVRNAPKVRIVATGHVHNVKTRLLVKLVKKGSNWTKI